MVPTGNRALSFQEQMAATAEAFPTVTFSDDEDELGGGLDGVSETQGGDKKKKKKKKQRKQGPFEKFGLDQNLLYGIKRLGYRLPTPVQRKTIPVALEGHDMVAMARTGSGKTASFLIPLVNRLKAHTSISGARGLVLSPTRELASQTLRFARALCNFTSLRVCLIVGGDSIEAQWAALSNNPDIIVATPGRLAHHLTEISEFSLEMCEMVIFDEADRLFEMGFAEQLRDILEGVPASRQTLLFSATLPKALVDFARAGLREPKLIRLDTDTKISENLRMAFLVVRKEEKAAALLHVLKDVVPAGQPTIVFASTRHHVEYLAQLLAAAHIPATHIYGAMDSMHRKDNLQRFRNHKKTGVNVMVVTDVAARGIDIPLLDNTINYDFPARPKVFVHRVGRVARAGRIGTAVSLVSNDELPYMIDLHLFLGRRVQDGIGRVTTVVEGRTSVLRLGDSSSDVNPADKTKERGLDAAMRTSDMVDDSNSKASLSCGYSFAEMTPDMVHYGRLAQSRIDAEVEWVLKQLRENVDLASQKKSSENAYKLYLVTRPDSSSQSVKRAKALPIDTLHPLVVADTSAEELTLNAVRDKLRGFRPSLTVFETEAMKNGKTAPDFIRSKRSLHGSSILGRRNQREARDKRDAEITSSMMATSEVPGATHASPKLAAAGAISRVSTLQRPQGKRKMSKAERKRLAKMKRSGNNAAAITAPSSSQVPRSSSTLGLNTSDAASSSFRDDEHYISMEPADHATEQGYAVTKSHSNLEDAMLDLNPDAVEDMHKQQRKVLHWDRKKKKYIKLGMNEIDGATGKRKKTDHGKGNQGKKKKQSLQKQYDKWSDKSKRKIARVGAPEDSNRDEFEVRADWRNGFRSANKKTSHGIKHTYQESVRSMREQAKALARRSKGGMPKSGLGEKEARGELRSEQDIRRMQKQKEKRQMQARGIRPHKKLKPNQPRPSKQKIQFKNVYGTASGTGGKGRKKRRR